MADDVRTAARNRQMARARETDPSTSKRLALRDDQDMFTAAQIETLTKVIGVKNATDADLRLYFHVCRNTGLDPFLRQIYMIQRGQYDHDAKKVVPKQTIQVGIDGFRLARDRAERRGGFRCEFEDTVWYDADGKPHEVWLSDDPPFACKVVLIKVFPDGGRSRFPKTIRFDAYADYYDSDHATKAEKLRARWADDPSGMIEKCFSSDTEVLTEHGFRRFSDVGRARIAQVTSRGLELVHAVPFAQPYDGPMVAHHSDRLDFSVTPDHDMVTTVGKAEARTLLHTATYRPKWRIPLTAPGRTDARLPISDDRLRLAGYFLADGSAASDQTMTITVSRPRKIAALERLGLHRRAAVRHSAGYASSGAGGARVVTTHHDRTVFHYNLRLLTGTGVTPGKAVSPDVIMAMSQAQARALLDAWVEFDGNLTPSGTRRLYTSRPEHVGVIELLAAAAGYTVNVPRKRVSDISDRPNYAITLSASRLRAPVCLPWKQRPGITTESNADGWVWCVTVPSHQIIVRRNGMAMVCGQCAEAGASRRACPQELSGLYLDAEMAAADRGWQQPRQQVTAEVIRTEPTRPAEAPAAGGESPAPQPDADLEAQRKTALGRIHSLFRDHGWGDNDDAAHRVRVAVAANLGRDADSDPPLPITTTADLDVWQADRVADRLTQFCAVANRDNHAALARMAKAVQRELAKRAEQQT